MKYAATFVGPIILAYLFGSFVAASFDITTWDVFGRIVITTFGISLSLGLSVLQYLNGTK